MSPYDYDCRWKLWKVCFEYLLAAGGRLLARPVRAPDGERRGKGRGKLVVLSHASQLGERTVGESRAGRGLPPDHKDLDDVCVNKEK